jgi:hypothetical protein
MPHLIKINVSDIIKKKYTDVTYTPTEMRYFYLLTISTFFLGKSFRYPFGSSASTWTQFPREKCLTSAGK